MTEAVFDFAGINRRMNRKPEPLAVEAIPVAPKPLQTASILSWMKTNPQSLDALYRVAASAKQSARNNLMDNLRAEVEQMERELLRLDEVLTRACPR